MSTKDIWLCRYYGLINGFSTVIHKGNILSKIAVAIYLAIIGASAYFLKRTINSVELEILFKIYNIMYIILLPLLTLAGLLITLTIIGVPKNQKKLANDFWRIGLYNHANEVPILIKVLKSNPNNSTILEFYNNGLSKKDFQDKQNNINAILEECREIDIITEKDNKFIQVITVPTNAIPPRIVFNRTKYLSDKENIINLGIGKRGLVSWNLEEMPHAVIAGSTNSGKTVLLLSIISQFIIKKNFDFYIIDYSKKGIDYLSSFPNINNSIITEEYSTLNTINMILNEMDRRLELFKANGVKKFEEYNKLGREKLKRIVLIFDEVSDALDKDGQSKEQREIIAQIEAGISKLCKLSRFAGISVILSGQRIDANLLSGHIRSNIPYRICGRADKNLSNVVLGDYSASESILTNERGLFIDTNGTVFRGFLPDVIL